MRARHIPAHRYASLVGSPYDVAPTGRALSAARAVTGAARTPATALIGAVFVAPIAPRRQANPGRPLASPLSDTVALADPVDL
jgi:hypothetical protein